MWVRFSKYFLIYSNASDFEIHPFAKVHPMKSGNMVWYKVLIHCTSPVDFLNQLRKYKRKIIKNNKITFNYFKISLKIFIKEHGPKM